MFGLLISGCHLSEVFEFVEESLDEVALAVDGRIDAALCLAILLDRDMPRPPLWAIISRMARAS